MRIALITSVATSALLASSVRAGERYVLLTGADERHYPGVARTVIPIPGPGVPGTFYDGDRLAGTADVGPVVVYQGTNEPGLLFQPNEFGSLSMLFRRGSVPLGPSGTLPFMGIEFLGGPRLDLDGDLANGVRSLIPVQGQTPALIPGIRSYVELQFDLSQSAVDLLSIDASGNNEGGPQVGPEIAAIIVTLAGTASDGTPGDAINAVDSRNGSAIAFLGQSGTLAGVYRIEELGFELWEDTILYSPSTLPLGTLQYLGELRGWMVERDAGTGQFPTLAGEGLGDTLWPHVDTTRIGQSFNTSLGDTAVIAAGVPNDQFAAPNNGGLALTDFGGDLGAYLDQVVAPRVPSNAHRYLYLEAAGWGINNSADPVFLDTISYDVVLIAAANCPGDADGNGAVGQADLGILLAAFGSTPGDAHYNAAADFDFDDAVGQSDLGILSSAFGTSCR